MIRGTWHPTGGSYNEDTIRDRPDPDSPLWIDGDWGLDEVDAAALHDFANQEGLQ